MKNKVYIIYPKKIGTIAPELYGHFTEHLGGTIYDGIWVGKDSKIPNEHGFRKYIIEKLKQINAPVIRWPGGCFAESYNWRDGIGEKRPVRYSWWTCHDGKYEDNTVGTHEFVDFCSLAGAKPYFAANITSTTAADIRDWMDYCLSPENTTTLSQKRKDNGCAKPMQVPFWGVGNENWGGGGNMTSEYYADLYRQYSTVLSNLPFDVKLIAGGANAFDYNWTKTFMKKMENSEKHMHGYSFHYYCDISDSQLEFDRNEWYSVLHDAQKMNELIERHWAIIVGSEMEKYAKLAVDEWGLWNHGKPIDADCGGHLFQQQSTMRDAVMTALTLNIFNNQCDKVNMANVAQLVNDIHSLFIAHDEKCITTPTYHVFDLYKNHMNGQAVETVAECAETEFQQNNETNHIKNISVSASVKNGRTTLTVANLSADEDLKVEIEALGASVSENMHISVLAADDCHAHNTFDMPDIIAPKTYQKSGNKITVPKASVTSVQFDNK